MSASRTHARDHVSPLGADGAALLGQELGLSNEALAALQASGDLA
jgi:hypothetical protein